MTRRHLSLLLGGFFILISSAHAEMMYGPAIVGTAPGGADVHVFADNGNGFFDPLDDLIKTVSANSDGEFSVSDLDIVPSYFVASEHRVSELTSVGEVKKVIDSFDITQSVISNPLTGARVSSVIGPDEKILGNHRHLFVEAMNGSTAEAKLRVNPFSQNSFLQMDMTAGTKGKVMVSWNGLASSTELNSVNGLNMDFTGDGLFSGVTLGLAVDRAGEGQMLTLAMHSPTGMSVAEVKFPYDPIVDPTNLARTVAFSDFVGDADPTNVSSFQMMIDETMPSLDAQVNLIGLTGPASVSLVPEPTGLALMSLGLLGLLGRYRRDT